ncbi:MAG: hypothetical protein JW969_19975 [Spirochaetales bacterium]|nr:hypothetical protein [Spirochaetales bacterium]
MRVCYFCKTKLDDKLEIFRTTECPSCGKPLKICKACVFYSAGAHWDCHETIDEPVRDKEASNFCSYFKYSDKLDETPAGGKNDASKDAFNKLFNDG